MPIRHLIQVIRPLVLFLAAGAIAAFAQPFAANEWRVREPGDKPLTGERRWQIYTHNAFASPGAATRVVIASTMAQIVNGPNEWQRSWSGYGKRVGTSALTFTAQDTVEHGVAALTGRDPRYQRCQCASVWKRVGHSFTGIVASVDNQGHRRFDLTHVGGAYAGGYVAASMYPSNYSVAVKGAQLGHRMVGQLFVANLLAEFSPEMRKLFRRGKK